jgi:hypothetical protein
MDDNIIPFPEREPAPETHEPLEVFTALAVEHGLIRPGDKLDQNVIDFAFSIVAKCAAIGDEYPDHQNDGSAGDHIRAIYGEP